MITAWRKLEVRLLAKKSKKISHYALLSMPVASTNGSAQKWCRLERWVLWRTYEEESRKYGYSSQTTRSRKSSECWNPLLRKHRALIITLMACKIYDPLKARTVPLYAKWRSNADYTKTEPDSEWIHETFQFVVNNTQYAKKRLNALCFNLGIWISTGCAYFIFYISLLYLFKKRKCNRLRRLTDENNSWGLKHGKWKKQDWRKQSENRKRLLSGETKKWVREV